MTQDTAIRPVTIISEGEYAGRYWSAIYGRGPDALIWVGGPTAEVALLRAVAWAVENGLHVACEAA